MDAAGDRATAAVGQNDDAHGSKQDDDDGCHVGSEGPDGATGCSIGVHVGWEGGPGGAAGSGGAGDSTWAGAGGNVENEGGEGGDSNAGALGFGSGAGSSTGAGAGGVVTLAAGA